MNRIALAVLFIALMVVLALCVVLAKRLASERAPRPPSTVVTGGTAKPATLATPAAPATHIGDALHAVRKEVSERAYAEGARPPDYALVTTGGGGEEEQNPKK